MIVHSRLYSTSVFEEGVPVPVLAAFVSPRPPPPQQVSISCGWIDPGACRSEKISATARNQIWSAGGYTNNYTTAAPVVHVEAYFELPRIPCLLFYPAGIGSQEVKKIDLSNPSLTSRHSKSPKTCMNIQTKKFLEFILYFFIPFIYGIIGDVIECPVSVGNC